MREPQVAALAAAIARPVGEVTSAIERAKRSMVPQDRTFTVVERGRADEIRVTREGVGPIDTVQGRFWQYGFSVSDNWRKYSAIVMAEVDFDYVPQLPKQRELLLRVDSGCETGQVFGDRTCECRDQLHRGLEDIANAGYGVLVSIPRQDGRGMGLPFKLATLALQQALGMDTVQSASALKAGGDRDVRTYGGMLAVLKFLGVGAEHRVAVATNNPSKLTIFEENGFMQVCRHPIVIAPTEHTRRHLEAKQEELGHMGLVDGPIEPQTQE